MSDRNFFRLMCCVSFLVVLGAPAMLWYKAARQSAQYERQGIHLSTWDCFIGVKPAEQVIQVKESAR